MNMVIILLQYTLLFATVLSLVALGGCFAEHSGVINLGLEGIMVMSALGGALTFKYLGADASPFIIIIAVLLVSIIVGVLYSTLLGIAAIKLKADQTLVGTAMNMLGTAAATVIAKAINLAEDSTKPSSEILYPGRSAFLFINGYEFNLFMVIAVIALIGAYIVLYKTKFGLRLMACGEHPQAAD